jgi:ketosteroid isomerase-like protein
MGSEGVELVRRVYLAWQAGDLEELLLLVDPEVRWSPVLRFLEGEGPAVGHRGLRRWFRRIRITYRSLRPVPHRFEDHGSRVLVLGRLVGASRLEEGDLDVRCSRVVGLDRPRRPRRSDAGFLEEVRRERRSRHARGSGASMPLESA